MSKKKSLIIGIELGIALLFFIGADWGDETFHRLFHSYFADIFLPFGYYFLLVLVEYKYKIFGSWSGRALSVFLLCAASETLQYFGIYALATVFDSLDYIMYAAGIILAIILDRAIFKRIFGFWNCFSQNGLLKQ